MNTSRALLLSAALLALAACGGSNAGGPDGGSNRIICKEGISSLAVNVKDSTGAPVKDATVSAKNVGTGTTITSTTNDQGIATAITADQGSGTIQLKATSGTRTSDVVQIDWLCGECACTATPANPTLILP